MLDTVSRGRLGERVARRWLMEQGFRIVDHNVSSRWGEIDLVAVEGSVLCFIEVKAKAGRRFGDAASAVTRTKQAKLIREAKRWLARHPWSGPCRFDVLALDRVADEEGGEWRIRLIRGAFEAGGAG